jgi:lysine 2,3-aminomutase
MLLSQTVFLKNINNSESILYELFSKLIYLSLKPYYIYHCDAVTGLESYSCNISNEIEIMRNLRKKLSGLAIPQHISDTEFGKFPIF